MSFCDFTSQNFGYSSRLPYDESTYRDKLEESVAPLYYNLNTDSIYNCNACMTTLGPRSSYMGFGVSMPISNQRAVTQTPEMVNIESILTNRNVNTSKNRKNQVNPINVTKFKLQHPRICDEYLNPISSKLEYPSQNYRELAINRFIDLPKNPQSVIFWDTAINSRLEAKDNFIQEVPKIWSVDTTLPHEIRGRKKCRNIKICSINDNTIDHIDRSMRSD